MYLDAKKVKLGLKKKEICPSHLLRLVSRRQFLSRFVEFDEIFSEPEPELTPESVSTPEPELTPESVPTPEPVPTPESVLTPESVIS
jgi:hypothetical protein